MGVLVQWVAQWPWRQSLLPLVGAKGALAEAPRHSFVVGLPSAKSNHVVEGEVDLFVHRRQLVASVKILLCRRQRAHEALAQLGLYQDLRRHVINRNHLRNQA